MFIIYIIFGIFLSYNLDVDFQYQTMKSAYKILLNKIEIYVLVWISKFQF